MARKMFNLLSSFIPCAHPRRNPLHDHDRHHDHLCHHNRDRHYRHRHQRTLNIPPNHSRVVVCEKDSFIKLSNRASIGIIPYFHQSILFILPLKLYHTSIANILHFHQRYTVHTSIKSILLLHILPLTSSQSSEMR